MGVLLGRAHGGPPGEGRWGSTLTGDMGVPLGGGHGWWGGPWDGTLGSFGWNGFGNILNLLKSSYLFCFWNLFFLFLFDGYFNG